MHSIHRHSFLYIPKLETPAWTLTLQGACLGIQIFSPCPHHGKKQHLGFPQSRMWIQRVALRVSPEQEHPRIMFCYSLRQPPGEFKCLKYHWSTLPDPSEHLTLQAHSSRRQLVGCHFTLIQAGVNYGGCGPKFLPAPSHVVTHPPLHSLEPVVTFIWLDSEFL